MDTTVQRLLNDKLYDKRKQGALELVECVTIATWNLMHVLQRRKDCP